MSEYIHMQYMDYMPTFYFVYMYLPNCSEMRIGVNEICFKKCVRNRKYALLEQFACMKSVKMFCWNGAWAFRTLFWKWKFWRIST